MSVTKNKKKIQKQKNRKEKITNSNLDNVITNLCLENITTDICYLPDVVEVKELVDKLDKQGSNFGQQLNLQNKQHNFIGQVLTIDFLVTAEIYPNGVPFYRMDKYKEILKIFMITKKEYQEVIKMHSKDKYMAYVYKHKLMPRLINSAKNKGIKRSIFDREAILKEINDKKDSFDMELGLRQFIDSLNTEAFFKKPPVDYKNFPYVKNVFDMHLREDENGKSFLMLTNSGLRVTFCMYNWDLLKVAFMLKDDRELVDLIASKTDIDLSTSYENIYDKNIRFLENLDSHKNDYPYTYKLLKSGAKALIALNEEHKLLAREDTNTFNGMPMIYTSMSYLANKVYPDKEAANVKPCLSRQIAVYNYLGILSIVPMSMIPKKELAYAIDVAKRRNTLNLTNYYVLYDLEDNINEIERLAEFSYHEGLRTYYRPKDKVRNVYKAYEAYLKDLLEYSPDEKEYVLSELNRLRDVYVTNFSPITIYDAAEYLRNEVTDEFYDDLLVEAKTKKKEFVDIDIKEMDNSNFDMKVYYTLLADRSLRLGMKERIKFNKFYTFLEKGYKISPKILKKLQFTKYVNWLYVSFGDTIKFPDQRAVDKRLRELNSLFFHKLSENSTLEEIKNYDASKYLLDKYSFSDYYKPTEKTHFNAVMDYAVNVRSSKMFRFMYMRQYQILSGDKNLLMPYVNFSSKTLKKKNELDRFIKDNFRTYSLVDSSVLGREFR